VMTALAAIVPRLIRRAALGTRATHESVGQKRARLRIVELLDVSLLHEPGLADCPPEFGAKRSVLLAVRAAVIRELNIEAGKVAFVGGLDFGDQRLLAAAFLPCANHRGRAVRVVGAHVNAAVADELLEAHPNIGLDGLEQIPDVDIRVDIRQSGRDKNSTHNESSQLR
jgi:hypothetical protein